MRNYNLVRDTMASPCRFVKVHVFSSRMCRLVGLNGRLGSDTFSGHLRVYCNLSSKPIRCCVFQLQWLLLYQYVREPSSWSRRTCIHTWDMKQSSLPLSLHVFLLEHLQCELSSNYECDGQTISALWNRFCATRRRSMSKV